ncbi:hypothetical protein GCM10010329_62290 [Streptomyces spiroverticillatus]|uniref:Uncharacterized protein n=1 Tax=Streptomyces finlayi TaxID=67296 RepID=A0A918X637_9ACTN|nr:hypothetical protein GCM10010329_62290 [Streptomyces spiroverticillatus]GHD14753.1 hypothetical protein GCM10010334_74140 [Streptomyces finlayi]
MVRQAEPSEFHPWTKTTGSGPAAATGCALAADAGPGRRDARARRSVQALRGRFLITGDV